MDQDMIDQQSEVLSDAIQVTLRALGAGVTQALLIHYLHEVSLLAMPQEPALDGERQEQ